MRDVPQDTFAGRDELGERVETCAGWVRELRASTKPVLPDIDGADPFFPVWHELRLLADAMERQERETLRLFDLVQHALRGVLLDDVLNEIYLRFADVIPYDRISCAFLSDDQQSLTVYWAASRLTGERIPAGYSASITGSSLLDVIATGQPRIINDLVAYLESKPGSQATSRIIAEGGRSSLTCPLFVDNRPTGFLFFTSHSPNTYQAAHQSIFRQIAAQISLVLHRSRTHTELVRHNSYLLKRSEELEYFCQLARY